MVETKTLRDINKYIDDAIYFGIGETRLYQIVAEHPGADFILEIWGHVKIKRVLFERFLDAASCV